MDETTSDKVKAVGDHVPTAHVSDTEIDDAADPSNDDPAGNGAASEKSIASVVSVVGGGPAAMGLGLADCAELFC